MTKTIDIVEQNNEMIADFMGWIWPEELWHKKLEISNLKYHSSWDWLMPVVKKIHELNTVGIAMHYEIEKQWNVVVSFIQWYNSQKQ